MNPNLSDPKAFVHDLLTLLEFQGEGSLLEVREKMHMEWGRRWRVVTVFSREVKSPVLMTQAT